jgi:hypothetical protein
MSPAPAEPAGGVPVRRAIAPLFGSIAGSAAIHACLILSFGLMTWAIGSAASLLPGDFQAEIVAAPGGEAGLGMTARGGDPPAGEHPDRPAVDSLRDLASLLDREQLHAVQPVGGAAPALDELSARELSRGDIVGIGEPDGASGEARGGGGYGGRDPAGGGPIGSLWGVGEGQRARSVVYVMDRSGSMSDTFGLLQRELMRAVGSLGADQLFNVIWFNEGRATELFPRMKPATLDNKREAFAAIKQIVPSGQTEPLDAVRRGLGYRPDVLFLLSDGDFGEENKRIMDTIRQRNRGRATRINTILFVYDTMGEGELVLRRIAEDNGGVYKHVTEDELSR